MSEKRLRELFGLMSDDHVLGGYYKLVPEALADEPDVVKVLRWAYDRLKFADGGGEESALLTLIEDVIEGPFHVRLTETGWEWTE